MSRIAAAVLCFVVLFDSNLFGQDTLPEFSVIARSNNRNVVSWTNPFRNISQISIQRSADSTRNFKTILTVPDPSVPQNGVVDAKAPRPDMFYRLFILRDSGRYQFSRSKRPAPDTAAYLPAPDPETKASELRVVTNTADSLRNRDTPRPAAPVYNRPAPPPPKPEKFFTVRRKDSTMTVSEKYFKKFRDSVLKNSKDTLVFESEDLVLIKPFIPREVYKPSRYVFTEKYGNVMILLPEAGQKKYTIHFFEQDDAPLFELEDIRSSPLVLDKTNFVHSGWFRFELYEDGKLKEKHRFFIPKDF